MRVPKPRKLPSGSWNIELKLDGQRISVTRPTKKECENVAALIKAEHRSGIRHIEKPSDMVLRDAVEKYIESRENVLSPSTIRGYQTIARSRFKDTMPCRISKIRNWQAVINAESRICGEKTLKNAWGFLKTVLKENGIDPGTVTLPQVIRKERAFLEPDQIKSFIKAAEGDRYELFYLLALHGLRRSEVFGMKRKNISDGIIHVRGAMVSGPGSKLVAKESNKNQSSRRDVPMLIPRIEELLSGDPEEYLFGKSPARIEIHLHDICRNAGLPDVTLHELRHSFASLCYHLGLSEQETMRLGGWSDPAVMRRIYTHLAQTDKDTAVEKLKNFFQKAE